MAESGVIREFFVALGFKLDEKGLRDFDEAIDRTTKGVTRLATAVTATALAVSAAATKIASNLEKLYFASIKANDSATNLKAFDRAAQNLGTEAGEALASAQALARFLRTNPGGEGLLASLGVDTRDANGELRGTTDLLLDLAGKFRGMEYYLANQYAGMFGISEDTLRAMRSGGFEREVLRMREQMRNTGFDKAAKDAHRFMMELRDLVTQLEVFGVQIFDALSARMGRGMRSLTDWLRVNGPMLAQRTADILLKMIELADRVLPVLGWLVNKFIELDKATGGWSTKILAVLAVMKVFGGFAIVRGILSLAGAFGTLTGSIVASSAATTGLLGIVSKLGVLGATGAAAYGAGTLIQKSLPDNWNDKIGRWVAQALMLFRNRGAAEALAANDPQKFFEMRGWSPDQAAGIVANLIAESGLDPEAVGDNGNAVGIAQWHPDRQQAIARRFGKEVDMSSLVEQMDYVDWELRSGPEKRAGDMLRAAQNAQQAAEIMARYYERPANIDAEVAKRSQLAVNLRQDTKIIVQGSGDPVATGRATAGAQHQVNADLARNLAAVVQ